MSLLVLHAWLNSCRSFVVYIFKKRPAVSLMVNLGLLLCGERWAKVPYIMGIPNIKELDITGKCALMEKKFGTWSSWKRNKCMHADDTTQRQALVIIFACRNGRIPYYHLIFLIGTQSEKESAAIDLKIAITLTSDDGRTASNDMLPQQQLHQRRRPGCHWLHTWA